MRLPLTTSGLAVLLPCAMAVAAFAGGSAWESEGYHRSGDTVVSTASVSWEHDGAQIPTGPVIVSAPASTTTTAPPSSDDGQPARFVDLWVVIAGAVGLLLVVQVVRIERSWRHRSDGGGASRNDSHSGGV